jgi:uncharacterized protein (DUF3820 family)
MPFGKFKGTPVLELEPWYLSYLWWDFQRDKKQLTDPLRANVINGLKSYNIDIEGEKPVFGNRANG